MLNATFIIRPEGVDWREGKKRKRRKGREGKEEKEGKGRKGRDGEEEKGRKGREGKEGKERKGREGEKGRGGMGKMEREGGKERVKSVGDGKVMEGVSECMKSSLSSLSYSNLSPSSYHYQLNHQHHINHNNHIHSLHHDSHHHSYFIFTCKRRHGNFSNNRSKNHNK